MIVKQNMDPHPIVIDADDLLENPRGIMEHYCKETGLPFEEQMLTWEPGEVEGWMTFTYSHVFKETVMKSSGFIKPKEKTDCGSIEHLSKEVQDVDPRAAAIL